MILLDNPDLINDVSLLLYTDLLESQVTRVGEVEPGVAVVCGPEGGPGRMILGELVMLLPAPGGARGDVNRSSWLVVRLVRVGAGHHGPVVGWEESLITVFMGPD